VAGGVGQDGIAGIPQNKQPKSEPQSAKYLGNLLLNPPTEEDDSIWGYSCFSPLCRNLRRKAISITQENNK